MARQEGTVSIPGEVDVTIADPQSGADKKKLKENLARALDGIRTNVCPVRDIMARISDKWSLLTILALGAHGTLRFSQIKKQIGDVSQRMLTVTLKNLEDDGFIHRHAYAEVPPRVEYTLTPIGLALMEQVRVFTGWIDDHQSELLEARRTR